MNESVSLIVTFCLMLHLSSMFYVLLLQQHMFNVCKIHIYSTFNLDICNKGMESLSLG